MELTITSLKYGLAVVAVGGAAAGLNLGVIQLTDPPAEDTVSQVELTASAESATEDPLQVIVDVPVVVPDVVFAADEAAPAAIAEAVPAGQGSLAVTAGSPAPVAAPTTASTTAPATGAAKTAPAGKAPAATDSPSTAPPRITATTAAALTTPTPTAAAARRTTTTSEGLTTTTEVTTTTTAPRTSATQAPTTTAATAATEYLYYEFSGVASQIVVAQHGDGSLEFWAVTIEPGWSYNVEEDSPREVEIEFRREEGDDEDEAKFQLKFEDGRLKVDKER